MRRGGVFRDGVPELRHRFSLDGRGVKRNEQFDHSHGRSSKDVVEDLT